MIEVIVSIALAIFASMPLFSLYDDERSVTVNRWKGEHPFIAKDWGEPLSNTTNSLPATNSTGSPKSFISWTVIVSKHLFCSGTYCARLNVTCSRLSSTRFMSFVLWTMCNSSDGTFPTMTCLSRSQYMTTLLIAAVMCTSFLALCSLILPSYQ